MVRAKVGDPDITPSEAVPERLHKNTLKEFFRVFRRFKNSKTDEERESAWWELTKYEHTDFAQKVLRLQEQTDDMEARKKYANRVFWLIVFWLLTTVATVWLAGFGVDFSKVTLWGGIGTNDNFSLPDPVIIAFLTTTTVNVLGLMYVVMRYMFPPRKSDERKKNAPDE